MPVSPSLGMPGGSWTIEEEDGLAPQNSVSDSPVNGSPQYSPASIKESFRVHSEIVLLDSANLSEEIHLLASPTASEETWRVRISPEYDIEVLPPELHQPDTSALRARHVRDSPQQRRSRCLDNIFPEIKDDIHSASRSSADNDSVLPILDLEWDFAQYDYFSSAPDASPAGDDEDGLVYGIQDPESLAALDLLGLAFPSPVSVDDPSREGSASAPGNSPLPPSPAESDVDDDLSSTHSSPSPPVTSISLPSTARPSVSPSRSTVRTETDTTSSGFGDSDDDDDSDSPRPQDADDPFMLTPSSLIDPAVVADHHDSESLLSMFIRPATTSVISDDEADEEGQDEEDLDRVELEYLDEHPAMTPLSLFGIDEISLPLSLDSSFGFPNDWVLVPHEGDALFASGTVGQSGVEPKEESVSSCSDGDADDFVADVEASSESEALQLNLVSQFIQGSPRARGSTPLENGMYAADQEDEHVSEAPHSPAASIDDQSETQTQTSLEAHELYSEKESISEPEAEAPQSNGGTDPNAVDVAAEEDPRLSEVPESPAASTSGQPESDDDWALPALHFHSPSLTDEVLSSPEFHAAVFRQDPYMDTGESSPGQDAAASRARHVRAFSTSNIGHERRSILWAPHDARDVYDTPRIGRVNANAKGKGRARTLTVSDSGFTGNDHGARRVESEVQTETDVERLRAKYVRLKKELRIEQARVAELVRRERDKSPERWESRAIAKLYSWGVPTSFEDAIM
ncbi:hypothetical protein B0H13DRAFT_2091722 [Mycena leptocephala]|nr:hypothetical protein B0H13DRAFT_2091722 [Mycena leptocephala]